VILEITQYGHPVLREKGQRITQITPELRQLAADMLETMYAANGVGLAAQQVGRAVQLAVIDVRDSDRPAGLFLAGLAADVSAHMPLVLINPKITHPQGEEVGVEGCLSIPEVSTDIRRAARITVHAQDLTGHAIAFDCTGLLARALQHEVDHLHGILFTDRMPAATRVGFAGQLKKLQKETLATLGKSAKRRRAHALP